MAKKQKVKPSIYLTDQNNAQLKGLVTWLQDRVEEMESEEEWLEENGDNQLPVMRGLISFLREEHLEEEDEELEDPRASSYDEDEEESYEEETDELDF